MGPPGYDGWDGATGDTGSQGPQGEEGPAGPTIPASIILVPKGETAATQPAVVAAGENQPELVIYGSGFPSGELLVATLYTEEDDYLLNLTDGDSTVRDSGAFTSEYGVLPAILIEPGVYSVEVTAEPSGIRASAMVVIVETK